MTRGLPAQLPGVKPVYTSGELLSAVWGQDRRAPPGIHILFFDTREPARKKGGESR